MDGPSVMGRWIWPMNACPQRPQSPYISPKPKIYYRDEVQDDFTQLNYLHIIRIPNYYQQCANQYHIAHIQIFGCICFKFLPILMPSIFFGFNPTFLVHLHFFKNNYIPCNSKEWKIRPHSKQKKIRKNISKKDIFLSTFTKLHNVKYYSLYIRKRE